MSPRIYTYHQARESFPRVSGDEPGLRSGVGSSGAFSPRERG